MQKKSTEKMIKIPSNADQLVKIGFLRLIFDENQFLRSINIDEN